jgi:GMP synthase (glutamine-hydrolysing)
VPAAAPHQKLLVVDFGGQYTQLIARRAREHQVYSEVAAWDDPCLPEKWAAAQAVILSGGPKSVLEAGAPTVDPALLRSGKPVLGICYGQQAMAHLLGGVVEKVETREYGRQSLQPSGSRLLEKPGQV